MLESVGASAQPYLTPFDTGNDSEYSLSFWTRASMPSWNCHTIVMNPAGQPNFAIIFQSSSRLTVSNALVRSTKVMYWSKFCYWHFSWSCIAETMSTGLLSFLNPHCHSSRIPA